MYLNYQKANLIIVLLLMTKIDLKKIIEKFLHFIPWTNKHMLYALQNKDTETNSINSKLNSKLCNFTNEL